MQTLPNTELKASTFIARQDRLLDQLSALSLDCIFIFGYGSALGAGTSSHGYIRYLTGWDSHEAFSLLILSKQERLLLISSPFMMPAAKDKLTETKVIFLPSIEWGNFLREKFSPPSAIGTIGFGEMPLSAYQPIAPLLEQSSTLDLQHQLSKMRLQKSDDEIILHRKGALICDQLFESLDKEFTNHRPVWQIQLSLEHLARTLGADYCKTWLTVKPCADYPRYWPEEGFHLPQLGDQVIFGVALSINGYWAHGIRMGAIGPAKKAHILLWELVMNMQQAGAEKLMNGNPLNTCETSMNEILNNYVTENNITSINRFRNGHGLGTSYEDPIISNYFPQHFSQGTTQNTEEEHFIIKSTMLFELHPNVFIPEVGGAAVGDMLLITDKGNESLLEFPTQLFEIACD